MAAKFRMPQKEGDHTDLLICTGSQTHGKWHLNLNILGEVVTCGMWQPRMLHCPFFHGVCLLWSRVNGCRWKEASMLKCDQVAKSFAGQLCVHPVSWKRNIVQRLVMLSVVEKVLTFDTIPRCSPNGSSVESGSRPRLTLNVLADPAQCSSVHFVFIVFRICVKTWDSCGFLVSLGGTSGGDFPMTTKAKSLVATSKVHNGAFTVFSTERCWKQTQCEKEFGMHATEV